MAAMAAGQLTAQELALAGPGGSGTQLGLLRAVDSVWSSTVRSLPCFHKLHALRLQDAPKTSWRSSQTHLSSTRALHGGRKATAAGLQATPPEACILKRPTRSLWLSHETEAPLLTPVRRKGGRHAHSRGHPLASPSHTHLQWVHCGAFPIIRPQRPRGLSLTYKVTKPSPLSQTPVPRPGKAAPAVFVTAVITKVRKRESCPSPWARLKW